MIRVLGLGDNVVDKYITLGLMFPGGQGMNFPVNAKILESSDISDDMVPPLVVEAGFIGVMGTDAAGDHIRATLTDFGVEYSHCPILEGESGKANIELIDGDRHFSGSNKGGIHRICPLRLTDDDLLYIKTFDIVHTSNNSYFDPEIPRLASAGIPVSYDFSDTYDEKRLNDICPHVQFGFFSCSGKTEEEIMVLLKRAHELGCTNCIATRGSEGPIYYNGHDCIHGVVNAIEPLDTLGAGDAFATGFLVSIIHRAKAEGWDDIVDGRLLPAELITASMAKGAELSLIACQTHGAFGHGAPIA